MKPWLRFALTAIAGVAFVIAYRVYQLQKNKKKPRKLIRNQDGIKEGSENKKTEKHSPNKKKKGKKIRATSSDILHPFPFDNVNGTMPSSDIDTKENSTMSQKDNSMKCIGSPTETDVEGKAISLRNSEYIKAPKTEKKSTASSEGSQMTSTESSKETVNEKSASSTKVNEVSLKSITTEKGSSKEEEQVKKSPKLEELKNKSETSSTQTSETIESDKKGKIAENAPSDVLKPRKTESLDGKIVFPANPPAKDMLSAVSSPANSDRGALDMKSISTTHSSPSTENIVTMYKMCRCRKNRRNEIVEDAQKAKFDPTIKVEVAPTEVLPVNFITYKPANLFEPSGGLTELPDICFQVPDNKADNYLSPLQPILNASHAAHYHACLINHLIENFDFFE